MNKTHPQEVDLKDLFNKIKEQYQAERPSFNALIYGGLGSGKTFGLQHARRPLLLHSFDPGGSRGLKMAGVTEAEDFIVDARFEHEDAATPTAYRQWEKEFWMLKKAGVFDRIGTYVLDSVTRFAYSLLNETLKANGRAPSPGHVKLGSKSASVPEQRDWMIQMRTIVQDLGVMCALPCDFIALAHIVHYKDELAGDVNAGPHLTGKLTIEVPPMFDEVWVTQVRAKNYQYLMVNKNRYQARSRLAGGGKLDDYEKQNIKAILKKAGADHADLVI